jgi:hypothetical protein
VLGIPRRFSYFVYGVIQSGLTCAIAAGIASLPSIATGTFVIHWLQSSFIAWIIMLPAIQVAKAFGADSVIAVTSTREKGSAIVLDLRVAKRGAVSAEAHGFWILIVHTANYSRKPRDGTN